MRARRNDTGGWGRDGTGKKARAQTTGRLSASSLQALGRAAVFLLVTLVRVSSNHNLRNEVNLRRIIISGANPLCLSIGRANLRDVNRVADISCHVPYRIIRDEAQRRRNQKSVTETTISRA